MDSYDRLVKEKYPPKVAEINREKLEELKSMISKSAKKSHIKQLNSLKSSSCSPDKKRSKPVSHSAA